MFFAWARCLRCSQTIIYAVPARDPLDECGHQGCATSVIEAAQAFGASSRQILLRGAVAACLSLHHGWREPDDHDGAGDGGNRVDDRRGA
jgi:hypothetical protein